MPSEVLDVLNMFGCILQIIVNITPSFYIWKIKRRFFGNSNYRKRSSAKWRNAKGRMGEKKPLGPNQGSDGGGKNFALIRGHVDEIRLRNTHSLTQRWFRLGTTGANT